MTARTKKKSRLPTVCLCMMVRNETRVLRRALESALPHVDGWCISDTGSTDGTVDLIAEAASSVPGLLVRADWVDFGTNRTRAFKAAQALDTDYILVMDADQTLVVHDPDWKSKLGADGYNIQIQHSTISYPHPWLLSAKRSWYWSGATHEYVHCDEPYTHAPFGGISLIEHSDSHRRATGAKMREDRALLEAAAERDPDDPRTQFYLAQVLSDVGEHTAAIAHYRRRVELGGWLEERWMAQYRIGRAYEGLRDWPRAVESYLAAFNLDPTRAETLYRIGRGELAHQRFVTAMHFFQGAADIDKPSLRLFLEDAVYDYAARWGLAMALRLLGWHEQAKVEEETILASERLPTQARAAILGSRANRSIGSLPI